MTKLNRTMRRIVVFAMVLAASAVGAQGAAALGCADYVSGWLDGSPFAGQLIGTKTVTAGFGASAGVSAHYSETFQVGTYRADNGGIIQVRCDIYQLYLD